MDTKPYDPYRRAWSKKKHDFKVQGIKITREEYFELYESTGGICPTCKKQFLELPASRNPAIDHCHDTGEVRGMICRGCNSALALLDNSIGTAIRMAAYLENFHIDLDGKETNQ